MQNLIRTLSLMIFLLPATMNAQSQKMKPAEERASNLSSWMKTNLNLSDDQYIIVQEINLRYAKKLDELKASSAPRRMKGQTLKKNDSAKDAELKAVLSTDQFATYLEKKEELKKIAREKMQERKEY